MAPSCTIVIPTYNRASDLRETLLSLATVQYEGAWEVVVVDNNSKDDTPTVVAHIQPTFPVLLTYVAERQQGRSAALNAGFAIAAGEVVLTTDDDVRFDQNWLTAMVSGLAEMRCDFVTGRVLPIWSAERPEWLPNRPGHHWGVIGIWDYGPTPFMLELSTPPAGPNFAVRKSSFLKVGPWNTEVGRKAGTLLGQELRDWTIRARESGLTGAYVPSIVHHLIPASRLTKSYFRRWFYWNGVARAIMYRKRRFNMDEPDDPNPPDLSQAAHILGTPRYMYRAALQVPVKMLKAAAKKNAIATFEHELWLWFFAGVVAQRFKDRRSNPAPGD